MNLPLIIPKVKIGNEAFIEHKNALGFSILDFWKWNQSNIIENRTRGILAEFIVKEALSIDSQTRIEWDDYDLITNKGTKIEVKSASYIQSWEQEKFSSIGFDIKPTLLQNGEYKRMSDIYIFCLLSEKNQENINPLDLNQWEFYILETKVLNEKKLLQKRISLSALLKLEPKKYSFSQLSQLEL